MQLIQKKTIKKFTYIFGLNLCSISPLSLRINQKCGFFILVKSWGIPSNIKLGLFLVWQVSRPNWHHIQKLLVMSISWTFCEISYFHSSLLPLITVKWSALCLPHTLLPTELHLKNVYYLYSACSNHTNVVSLIVLSMFIRKGAWYWDRLIWSVYDHLSNH
jgi:hypothetical protein